MSLLSVGEIKNLIEQPQGLCISIYLPVEVAGPEMRQNPIRFKNLIREAENRLIELGVERTEAGKMLEPALSLDEAEFWGQQDRGLALFVAGEFFHYYRLPIEVDELVVVSEQFHLKPLLQFLTGDGRFYILALSQQDLRLMEATRYNVKEVELENVPKSVDEAVNNDDTGKLLQNRIATSRGGTSNPFQQPGSFHGQGSPENDHPKQYILQFFHQIDHGLQEKLRAEKAPLVLAGVEYLFPIYREANTYGNLVEEGITGNPELLKPEELHNRALEIVTPIFEKTLEAAIERYQEASAAGGATTSSDLKEIVSSAYFQRVETLFVAVGQQIWGRFDAENNSVEIEEEKQPGTQDLLDFAAIHTFLNGGEVYAVSPEKMPEGKLIAAIFRY